jgi:hypothetical protein
VKASISIVLNAVVNKNFTSASVNILT